MAIELAIGVAVFVGGYLMGFAMGKSENSPYLTYDEHLEDQILQNAANMNQAIFITPDRVSDILKGKPNASLDDVIQK